MGIEIPSDVLDSLEQRVADVEETTAAEVVVVIAGRSGHYRDAGGNGAHGAGDVVGETDHARGFRTRSRFEFVERDDRARPHIGDLALHPEVLQHTFELARILLQDLV